LGCNVVTTNLLPPGEVLMFSTPPLSNADPGAPEMCARGHLWLRPASMRAEESRRLLRSFLNARAREAMEAAILARLKRHERRLNDWVEAGEEAIERAAGTYFTGTLK